MDIEDPEYEKGVQKVNESVADSGGCTEAWSSLVELRAGDEGSRRSFIKNVGIALGAVSLGATTTASAQGSSERADVETTALRGKAREELLSRVDRSEEMKFVTEQLGDRGEVVAVFEYDVSNGPSGRGVTYGTSADSAGRTIQYYESDGFDDGTRVTGSKPVGDGVMLVDGNSEVVVHTHETPRQEKAMAYLEKNKEYQKLKRALDGRSLREGEALVAVSHDGSETEGRYIVPLAEDDEVVNRVHVSGDGGLSLENVRSYSVSVETDRDTLSTSVRTVEGGVGTNQIEFSPCVALCGTLAGLSGSACFSACSGTIVGLPISPGCAAVCAGVASGVCVPTCNNLT